jgi:hypothetical protein
VTVVEERDEILGVVVPAAHAFDRVERRDRDLVAAARARTLDGSGVLVFASAQPLGLGGDEARDELVDLIGRDGRREGERYDGGSQPLHPWDI